MRNRTWVANLLLAGGLAALTLAVLAALSWLGGVEVQIESGWLKASGALAGFVVIYECLRRTVFGKPPSGGPAAPSEPPGHGA